MLDEVNFQEFGSVFWHDRIIRPASMETYQWADELLESAKAKHLGQSKAIGRFSKKSMSSQQFKSS
jgi:hypothetical protein